MEFQILCTNLMKFGKKMLQNQKLLHCISLHHNLMRVQFEIISQIDEHRLIVIILQAATAKSISTSILLKYFLAKKLEETSIWIRPGETTS